MDGRDVTLIPGSWVGREGVELWSFCMQKGAAAGGIGIFSSNWQA